MKNDDKLITAKEALDHVRARWKHEGPLLGSVERVWRVCVEPKIKQAVNEQVVIAIVRLEHEQVSAVLSFGRTLGYFMERAEESSVLVNWDPFLIDRRLDDG